MAFREWAMMGAMSPLHWLVVLGIVIILFGGGNKLSHFMGDAAKGIKSFKTGLRDDVPGGEPAQVEKKP